jgi:hypothetical protein
MTTLGQFERIQADAEAKVVSEQAEASRHQELLAERMRSFEALESLNSTISDRANKMLWALASAESHRSENNLLVILKYDTTSGRHVVGRLSRIFNEQEQFGYFNFEVFGTDEKGVRKVIANPHAESTRDVELPEGGKTKKSTYTIQDNRGEYDGISRAVRERSPTRRINPIAALERYLLRRNIAERLQALGDTIYMFEAAAADPDLNAHLAEKAKEADIPHTGDMVEA